MKKVFFSVLFTVMTCVTWSAANAYQYPGNISSLGNLVGDSGTLYTGELSGMFTATGVGYETGYTNSFEGGGNVIFSCGQIPNGVWSSAFNWSSAMFTSVQGLDSIDHIQVYRLNETWTVQGTNPISFEAGTYIVGYGDGIGDSDYDDLIIASRQAVPIPGAVWLLGTGLAGLAGLRRKKK